MKRVRDEQQWSPLVCLFCFALLSLLHRWLTCYGTEILEETLKKHTWVGGGMLGVEEDQL